MRFKQPRPKRKSRSREHIHFVLFGIRNFCRAGNDTQMLAANTAYLAPHPKGNVRRLFRPF